MEEALEGEQRQRVNGARPHEGNGVEFFVHFSWKLYFVQNQTHDVLQYLDNAI